MVYRDEYQPHFVLPEERGYYDWFYKPNTLIHKNKAEMEINQYLMDKGKISKD